MQQIRISAGQILIYFGKTMIASINAENRKSMQFDSLFKRPYKTPI